MVKQGYIVKTNFDPAKGHEQAGYRPALVISPALFTHVTNIERVPKDVFVRISNIIKASVDLSDDFE